MSEIGLGWCITHSLRYALPTQPRTHSTHSHARTVKAYTRHDPRPRPNPAAEPYHARGERNQAHDDRRHLFMVMVVVGVAWPFKAAAQVTLRVDQVDQTAAPVRAELYNSLCTIHCVQFIVYNIIVRGRAVVVRMAVRMAVGMAVGRTVATRDSRLAARYSRISTRYSRISTRYSRLAALD